MKQSVIQEAHAQHGTFLIGARFAGVPGLRASHSIQATFDTPGVDRMGRKKSGILSFEHPGLRLYLHPRYTCVLKEQGY